MIEVVKLTADEQPLYDSIIWTDHNEFMKKDFSERTQLLQNQGKLADSLLKRNVIPKIRIDWFTDPQMNIGSSKSHKQIFADNGNDDEAILKHPGFRPYLWYFIHGPKLPKSTIEGFCKIIEEDKGTSGDLLNEIKAYVRKQMRDRRLDYSAPDEFMMLAFEVGRADLASTVRSAAKTAM